MYKLNNNDHLDEKTIIDSFCWTTTYFHSDNSFTMNDYLNNHLLDGAEIMFRDESYAEVMIDGQRYGLDAKGNGDSYNHIVNIIAIQNYK
jgi:hypothetical protein